MEHPEGPDKGTTTNRTRLTSLASAFLIDERVASLRCETMTFSMAMDGLATGLYIDLDLPVMDEVEGSLPKDLQLPVIHILPGLHVERVVVICPCVVVERIEGRQLCL